MMLTSNFEIIYVIGAALLGFILGTAVGFVITRQEIQEISDRMYRQGKFYSNGFNFVFEKLDGFESKMDAFLKDINGFKQKGNESDDAAAIHGNSDHFESESEQ